MRDETMDLHTDVAASKIVVVITENRHTISGEAESVDRRGRNQIRVAKGCGLEQVVEATLRGVEDVARQVVRRRLLVSRNHVTTEQRLFFIHLIIDTADDLILVGPGDRPE